MSDLIPSKGSMKLEQSWVDALANRDRFMKRDPVVLGYHRSAINKYAEENPKDIERINSILGLRTPDEIAGFRKSNEYDNGADKYDLQIATLMRGRGVEHGRAGKGVAERMSSWVGGLIDKSKNMLPGSGSVEGGINKVMNPVLGMALDFSAPTVGALTPTGQRGNFTDNFKQGLGMVKDALSPRTDQQRRDSEDVARIRNQRKQEYRDMGVDSGVDFAPSGDPRLREQNKLFK